MPNRSIKNSDIVSLKQISRSSRNKQRALLRRASPRVLKLIAECCLNFCRGAFRLSPAKVAKLRRHRHVIRELAKRTTSSQRRKHLIVQKGGFLSLLLPGAISLLGSILGGAR